MDNYAAGDRSPMQGRLSVLATATERKRRYWDQPFSIQHKKKKHSLDGDTEREWLGG